MGYLAFVLIVLFGVFSVGWRARIHRRQTGRSPFVQGTANGKLVVVGYAGLFVTAVAADLSGVLSRVVQSSTLSLFGAALALSGIAATMYAQTAMGDSWRIGIDPTERTALVTTGPYKRVRNPIYTGMFAFAIGFALVIPNVAAIAAAIIQIAVIQLFVRRVEEPHLQREYGDAFRQWSTRTGRFLPRLTHS